MPKHKHIKFKITPNLLPNAARFRGTGLIGFFLSALLLGVGTFLLTIDNAAAQSPESGVSAAAETSQAAGSDQANVKVDVNIHPVLSLAVYPTGDHTTETSQVVLEPVVGGDLATNMVDLVVRTNVRTGYQLSIKDEDATTALVNTADNTKTIPTLDASTNVAGFPDNRWGYSVGAYNADNSEFRAVPVSTPDVIAQSEELLPGDGETTTVTFGVKIDDTVAGGIYEDKVVFTASPNLIPSVFKVTIHYRFADGTEAAPDYNENYVTGATYNVASPEVAGYTPSQAVVSGTIDDKDVEVTVVYKKSGFPDSLSGTKMQDFGSACADVPTPAASETAVPGVTLVDARDNKSYKVRKLADGKCWMVQDLNYTLSTSEDLTPVTSDVPSNWTPNNNTQTSTGTVWEDPSAITARSYTNGTRTYYNWYAATGGTTDESFDGGNASGSVCPKGWTLPASSDFNSLISKYGIGDNSAGSAKLRSVPLDFVYTGYYNWGTGSLHAEGSDGSYWSRTAYSGGNAYYLVFVSSGVGPQDNFNRGHGFALRCVAK